MVYESCFLLINKNVWNNSHTSNPDNNLSGGGGGLRGSPTNLVHREEGMCNSKRKDSCYKDRYSPVVNVFVILKQDVLITGKILSIAI